ncbi:LytTR family DNA-binding domain-containing protein [Tellurirhabdus bombi]|uniref:LytTR family DNA-binding domain-containing protein n=1 Tax=Tellurirhabdus bombi TaxID=2907205 RepID=UPI001F2C0F97|nr:LytTR family DNA-binding domain-containing protein [Tellurirhabdus bombi]
MQELVINRSLLKKPFKCISVLLVAALIFEGFSWMFAYPSKIERVNFFGGGFNYLWEIVRGLLLPEVTTLYILLLTLDLAHDILNLKKVSLTVKSVLNYQLRMLPVLLLAFFIFNPITQTIRYLLERFPNYQFNWYIQNYLLGTFTFRIYIIYLIPVLIMGYVSLNSSLIVDFIDYRAKQKNRKTAPVEPVAVLPSDPTRTALTHVRAKSNQGEILLPVQECFWFDTQDRSYSVVHPSGRFSINKNMQELGEELNPDQFFRVRRDCIINLSYVASYAYWEKGKYIIRMQTPANDEIDMPKARLQEFRNRLGYFQGSEPGVDLA